MDAATRIKHLRSLIQELSDELYRLESDLCSPGTTSGKKIVLDNTVKSQLADLVKGAKKR
jgi:hypothetical protein